jgi:hypothetical protein
LPRDEGRINVKSRWKEYGPTVEEDPVYVAVKKNTSGSRPKELFEDLVVVSQGWAEQQSTACMTAHVAESVESLSAAEAQ